MRTKPAVPSLSTAMCTEPLPEQRPTGAWIYLSILALRIFAIIAAAEVLESYIGALVALPDGPSEMVFDVSVMAAISAPLVYLWVVRPLIGRFAAHATLAQTAREQELALKASHEQVALAEYTETVLASVPSGLGVLSTELRVLSVNPAFRDMFSITDQEIVGQPLEKIFPGVNPWRLVAEVLGSDQPAPTVSVDLPDSDGTRHLNVRLTRFRQGEHIRLLLVIEDITDRIRLQEQAEAARARFWGILDAASDAIISVDESLRILVFNQQAERVFGYTADEAIGQPLAILLPARFQSSHADRMREFAADAVSRRAMGERPVLAGRRKNGEEFPVEITISKLNLDNRTVMTAIVRDVTQRERAERELRESREALQDFLDTASDLVHSVTPEGHIMYVNRAWLKALGYGREDLAALTIFDVIHPDRRASWQGILQRVTHGEALRNVETVFVCKDGRAMTVEGSVDARAKDGEVTVRAMFRDITERKLAGERLRTLAYHDALTGLSNRALFHDRLTQTLAQAKRDRRSVGLLYLDLDRFKSVNDTLGHAVGDQLLQTVAQRLMGSLRSSNTVCRLGGDEFTVILGPSTPEGAAVVARNILQLISQPMTIQGHEVSVTSSIGIAMFPTDGETIDALLKHADTAMYRAKTTGNAYQFYEASMHAQALDRFALERRLRRALDCREFEVFYQPQVDLASGRLAGVEALLRWRREDGELVLPGEFLPLAEETGLIVPIGAWVLNAACAQVRAWQVAGIQPPRMGVNVSIRQVAQADFADRVLEVLRATCVEPRLLELELTENSFMRDVETTTASLDRLREMGVGLAIDDFGTGYSSLSDLKRFAIGTLKIGRGFVRDVTDSADDAAIVTAVIAMANHLGLRVVAEGVEGSAHLEWLRARRVDVVQGNWIGSAVPAAAVAPFLAPTWRLDLSRAA